MWPEQEVCRSGMRHADDASNMTQKMSDHSDPKTPRMTECHVTSVYTYSMSLTELLERCKLVGCDPETTYFQISEGYDGSELDLYGRRMETQEEVEQRLAGEEAERARTEQRERELLKTLKKKYES